MYAEIECIATSTGVGLGSRQMAARDRTRAARPPRGGAQGASAQVPVLYEPESRRDAVTMRSAEDVVKHEDGWNVPAVFAVYDFDENDRAELCSFQH